MTPQQNDVLQAAIDLMNGGMDTEEALAFVTVRYFYQYVLNTIPPDAGEIDEQVKAE
jgi:hypothetical protein